MFDHERPSRMSRWPVLRVSAGAKVEVVLLSGDFVRLTTHFFKRTFLCVESERCPACAYLPSRSYWYLPVIASGTRAASLVELSSTASADLEQKAKFAGQGLTAGLRIEMSRRTIKSPVFSEVLGVVERSSLAKVHEWVSPLMAIYGLPPLRPEESLESYGDRVAPAVMSRAELAAASLEASAGRRLNSRCPSSP